MEKRPEAAHRNSDQPDLAISEGSGRLNNFALQSVWQSIHRGNSRSLRRLPRSPVPKYGLGPERRIPVGQSPQRDLLAPAKRRTTADHAHPVSLSTNSARSGFAGSGFGTNPKRNQLKKECKIQEAGFRIQIQELQELQELQE